MSRLGDEHELALHVAEDLRRALFTRPPTLRRGQAAQGECSRRSARGTFARAACGCAWSLNACAAPAADVSCAHGPAGHRSTAPAHAPRREHSAGWTGGRIAPAADLDGNGPAVERPSVDRRIRARAEERRVRVVELEHRLGRVERVQCEHCVALALGGLDGGGFGAVFGDLVEKPVQLAAHTPVHACAHTVAYAHTRARERACSHTHAHTQSCAGLAHTQTHTQARARARRSMQASKRTRARARESMQASTRTRVHTGPARRGCRGCHCSAPSPPAAQSKACKACGLTRGGAGLARRRTTCSPTCSTSTSRRIVSAASALAARNTFAPTI